MLTQKAWLALALAGLGGWTAALLTRRRPEGDAHEPMNSSKTNQNYLTSFKRPANAASHPDLRITNKTASQAKPIVASAAIAPAPSPPPPPRPPQKEHGWFADLTSSALSAGLASLSAKNSAKKQPSLLKTIYRGRPLTPASDSFGGYKPKTFPPEAPVKKNTFPRPKFERSRKAPKGWWLLLKTTVSDFIEDKAPRLAAALAYYTVFSIAPLLLISIAVAAFFFGGNEEIAKTELSGQLERFLGAQAKDAIVAMIGGASRAGGGLIATLLGLGALIFGASAVFAQMKDALNTIWEVEPKPGRGIMATVTDRALSFFLVLILGMLLLSSMVASTVLTTVTGHLSHILPVPIMVIHLANIGISAVVVTTIFAVIFKYLPDVEITWKDVFVGAAVTMALFLVGNYGIGLYISKAAIGSAYGPAGSILIVLLWANYSAMIFLLGAEFTQAYALMYGSQIAPAADAVMVEKRQ